MKNQPVLLEKYGTKVWTNEMMDELRKSECLCLNCASLKPGPDNCHIAEKQYQTCVEENVAMAMTRCPHFLPKVEIPENFCDGFKN